MHLKRSLMSVVLGTTTLILASCGNSAPQQQAVSEQDWGNHLQFNIDDASGISPLAAACPTQLDTGYNSSVLNVGLYWYSPSESTDRGGVGCKARADGAAIPGYFDPSKPTIIYVHGWNNGLTASGRIGTTLQSNGREDLFFSEGNLNVADAWIQAGWNVGIYQWTQLADDDGVLGKPYAAQAKIWTTTYPNVNMRFRKADGTFNTTGSLTRPAGDQFALDYKAAMAQFTGSEVRFVGHSLGSQMVLAASWNLYNDTSFPNSKKPRRVVFADPYWSPPSADSGQSYSYLSPDAHPAARARRLVPILKQSGVVFEWIKSSRVNDLGGDNNEPMIKSVSRTEVFPDYIFDWNVAQGVARKHSVAPRWYFWTRSFPVNSSMGVTASQDLTRATTVMNASSKYDQSGGKGTVTPSDDTFTKTLY
ncbi:hypothetical protein [Deinococcus misasensis]|uniref:hypothetical protein n=1 Tax=Deinococcus misasensis TaxID=392413 RepID=UPI00054D2F24|nr:hypothetical protein [Deinococcus misasensis]